MQSDHPVLSIKKRDLQVVAWLLLFTCTLGIVESFIGVPGFAVVQKGFLLFLVILWAFGYGIKRRNLGFIAIFSIATFVSTIMSTGDLLLAAITYLSIGMSFLLFAVNLPAAQVMYAKGALILTPFVSVLVAAILVPVTGKLPWVAEYTGAYRLSGAAIAPHLAMLCVTAIAMVSLDIKNGGQRRSYVIFIALFLTLVLTGTRGAIVAALVMTLPHLRFPRNFKSMVITGGLGIVLTLIAAAAYHNISLRNAQLPTSEAINLSGRADAWAYFIVQIEEAPLFGHGLGSVTRMTRDVLAGNLSDFVVPHNEYLRFAVDLGYVGLGLLVIGFAWCFRRLAKSLREDLKLVYWSVVGAMAIYSSVDNMFGTIQFLFPFFFALKYFQIVGLKNA